MDSLPHVMPVNSIRIILDKSRGVYHQGEYITGKVIVDNKYELRHDGLLVTLEGSVDISANFKSLNILDTFNGTTRTLPLAGFTYELIPPGRLTPGQTEVPLV